MFTGSSSSKPKFDVESSIGAKRNARRERKLCCYCLNRSIGIHTDDGAGSHFIAPVPWTVAASRTYNRLRLSNVIPIIAVSPVTTSLLCQLGVT